MPTQSAYFQTVKLPERRGREHRAAHPCRLHRGHTIMKSTDRKVGLFAIAVQPQRHSKYAELPAKKSNHGHGGALSESDKTQFAEAKSYLNDIMNGKTTLPTKAWKREYAKLTSQQKTLNQKHLMANRRVGLIDPPMFV